MSFFYANTTDYQIKSLSLQPCITRCTDNRCRKPFIFSDFCKNSFRVRKGYLKYKNESQDGKKHTNAGNCRF